MEEVEMRGQEGASMVRPIHPDPIQTDPDKYNLLFLNSRVRVLEYRDKPGDDTSRHFHHDFVLYTLSSFKRTFLLDDGREMERELQPGQVIWMDARTHVGRNTGFTETHVIIVELLEPRPRA